MRKAPFYKYLILCFLITICSGCSNNSLEAKIENHIKKACNEKDVCIINIKDITDFEWQKMYVFKEGTTLEAINEALGFEYPYFEDIARRTVFVSENRITYHEDIFPNPESAQDGQVIYEMPDTVQYTIFEPDDAVFKVNKVEFVQGVYYVLLKY